MDLLWRLFELLSRLFELLWRHPIAVAIGTLLITLGAASQLVDLRSGAVRIRVDPSVNRLLPDEDADRLFYERVRHVFGSDETVLVVVRTDDTFAPEAMQRIERLTERFETLPHAHQVLSLANAPNLRADAEGVEIRSFAELAGDPGRRRGLKQDALANPLYRDTLVSRDGRASAISITFKGISDPEFLTSGLARQIERIAREEANGADVWISGAPIVKVATSDALVRGLAFTLPAIVTVAVAVLWLAFGSLRGVLAPVVTILLALIWTLATATLLGRSLNLVTAIVPPLIITVGLAYAMHVVSELRESVRDAPGGDTAARRERVGEAMRRVGLPVVITGLTTAAGFIALTVSRVPAIQEFGWLSVLGVAYTLVLSLTFTPAAFLLAGGARARPLPLDRAFASASERLARFDLRHRSWIVAAGVALLGLALFGATRIRVGTEYIGGFPADAPVRVQYEAINETLGGANTFYVVIESHVDDAFVDPVFLTEIESLQLWLEAQPEVGSTTSMVDHLKLIHRSFNEGDPAYFRIPESKRLAKQLLIFGAGDEIEAYVDGNFRTANVVVRAKVEDTVSISNLVERLEARLGELPRPLEAQVTGSTILVTRTVDDIARGQVESITAALVIVYLVLTALFTSFRIGLLALLPNLLPIAVYFGALGASGATLNPSTSLIACIALGIAVDDTIHYLVRFNSDARSSASEERATFSALRAVIRPVSFTTLALVLGFLTLTGSELRNQVQFGALAAFTMAVAWITDVTLTPALGAGVRIVTLWDVLRLDLGRDPQRTIPLFQGLSQRQARVFALMSDVREIGAGQRLITEGEDASDIYVVIDGELAAWIERDGARIELSTMQRGAVVGEVGYFAAKRTANVDAVSDVRLIRFEPEDLERLRKRYPRIAAGVYANLNRIQAERLARTTQRVR